MKKSTIEIDEEQLLYTLEQLSPTNIKKIIDKLLVKKLIEKPDLKKVISKGKKAVRDSGADKQIVEEAIRWARKQK
jgi:ribosomal protein L12E/L44/L45/RPP1/RPP2